MKTLLLAIIVSLLPNIVLGTSDAVAEISKIHLTITDHFSKEPAGITIECSPNQMGEKTIVSITVNWRGSTVTIPKEELDGLDKLQVDTMKLCYGMYQDGRKYFYIDTFFGDHEKTAKGGFKQVWLLMQGNKFIERKTFITLQTGPKSYHFKQLTQKFKGEAATNNEKQIEQSGADHPIIVPKSKPEASEEPQPESKVAPR